MYPQQLADLELEVGDLVAPAVASRSVDEPVLSRVRLVDGGGEALVVEGHAQTAPRLLVDVVGVPGEAIVGQPVELKLNIWIEVFRDRVVAEL